MMVHIHHARVLGRSSRTNAGAIPYDLRRSLFDSFVLFGFRFALFA
jgi:hypothetical protein